MLSGYSFFLKVVAMAMVAARELAIKIICTFCPVFLFPEKKRYLPILIDLSLCSTQQDKDKGKDLTRSPSTQPRSSTGTPSGFPSSSVPATNPNASVSMNGSTPVSTTTNHVLSPTPPSGARSLSASSTSSSFHTHRSTLQAERERLAELSFGSPRPGHSPSPSGSHTPQRAHSHAEKHAEKQPLESPSALRRSLLASAVVRKFGVRCTPWCCLLAKMKRGMPLFLKRCQQDVGNVGL